MAETYRTINTRFWSDGWIRNLNALDRYLFIYLLTNEHVSWCGIYELELGMMAFECGIDKEDLQKTMLPRLEPKVIYAEGWVFIKNFARYHSGGKNAEIGRKSAFDALPDRIKAKISQISEKEGDKNNPLQGGSPFAFASAFASAYIPASQDKTKKDKKKHMKNSFKYNEAKSSDSYEDVIDADTGEVTKDVPKGSNSKLMSDLISWAEGRRGGKFANVPKQLKALSNMKEAKITPSAIKNRWVDMEGDKFWKDKGFDFMSVAGSFDRKPQ